MLFFAIEKRSLTFILLWCFCLCKIHASRTKAVNEAKESANNNLTTNHPFTANAFNNNNNELKSEVQLPAESVNAIPVANNENVVDVETVVAAAAGDAAEHMATDIVAPLTHIAHITYDSIPVAHKPNDHKPLSHRESHDDLVKL